MRCLNELGYTFYRTKIFGYEHLLAVFKGECKTPSQYRKDAKKIEEIFKERPVLVIPTAKSYERKRIRLMGINFIIPHHSTYINYLS